MDSNKANPREHLRQAIDAEILAEIKSLEEYTRKSIRALRTLRHRRNALAPISSLPTEVIAAIFSFLRVHVTPVVFSLDEKPNRLDHLAWLQVTHVCHQWREIAISDPLFWSYIDFTIFNSAGTTEILTRAKNAPLYLEARVPRGHWDEARFSAFRKELHNHVSNVCHLAISAERFHLNRTLKELSSPAPALEYLWLSCEEDSEPRWESREGQAFVPDTLFDGITGTPRLSCIKLRKLDVSWQSSLLRGVRHLDIRDPPTRPSLSVWLDALDEMPQLKTLSLQGASPEAPPRPSPPYNVDRTVTLPFLAVFKIISPARDCGLALAHLILPALTSLRLCSIGLRQNGSEVREIIPYVARHAHVLQDNQPLQCMIFSNDVMYTGILAWSLPDIDVDLPNPTDFPSAMRSERVAFSYVNLDGSPESDMVVLDAVMEALPLDDLITLTSQNRTGTLNELFWLRHVPRWPRLRRVRLSPTAGRGFREMLEYNGGRKSPLLPSLKELILIDTVLSPRRTRRLRDALMRRADRGVPLETLDLRTCISSHRALEILGEIVVDVLRPDETFETGAQILSASTARGLNHGGTSVIEGHDPLDTDSDDVARENREMNDSEDDD